MTSNTSNHANKKEANREQFPDGSALVTYQDGTVLLLESRLAKVLGLHETRKINYNDPPPPPPRPEPQ